MKSKLLTTCATMLGCLAIPASAQIIFLQDGSQQDKAPPSDHGGFNNGVAGSYSFVGGGNFNEVFDFYGTILGGSYNGAGSDDLNANTSRYASVGGGNTNVAYSDWSVIHGGQGNMTGADDNGTVVGDFSTIAGGKSNTASGAYSTVVGGLSNIASGSYSTVLSGQNSVAAGSYSFVAGNTGSDSTSSYSFVWAGQSGARTSAGFDTFNVWADGGIYFNGSVQHASDRNLKTEFEYVDPLDALRKVNMLSVSTWRFKSEDNSVLHMGPMAQDFAAIVDFVNLGDRHIATTDADGIALAAIQGLNQQITAKQAEIDAMLRKLEQIER